MKLIGLSGTNGAGKDSVGELLRDKYNFLFISMTEMLREEARSRNWDMSRESLRTISAEWRRESGLGVLIDKSVEHYEKLGGDEKYTGLVVASLRNPGENDRVHSLGGKVVWIDADPQVRYDRIYKRQRSEEDAKTFEEFLSEEQAEMQHSGDEATLSMGDVKARADKIVMNNGSTIQELEKVVNEELTGLL